MKRTTFSLSLIIASLVTAAPALAQTTSPTAEHGSVGALIGYGFKDGVNFGLGARGGYTLPMNLYLGGTFMYHLGKSAGPVDVNVFYFGVEGGYDIYVDPVVIRPYLGLGDAIAHASGSVCIGTFGCTNVSSSDGHFAAWPGVTVLYPIDNFFIGGDARFLIVSDFNAFSMFATGGVQF